MAGYSPRPLAAKLGIKEGQEVAAVAAPEGYEQLLEPLPSGVRLVPRPSPGAAFIHFFAVDRASLERELPGLKRNLAKDGMLWVSWPKKASGVTTDLDGNVVRAAALDAGLVDVKVCAVDETWSGLKLVYRLVDR